MIIYSKNSKTANTCLFNKFLSLTDCISEREFYYIFKFSKA